MCRGQPLILAYLEPEYLVKTETHSGNFHSEDKLKITKYSCVGAHLLYLFIGNLNTMYRLTPTAENFHSENKLKITKYSCVGANLKEK